MGMAPTAYTLFSHFLRFNPKNPKWFGRDRFVLSAGHGSALLYSLLHLYGYDLPMEQIKRFRQLESMTPGHPENFRTPGVETTTGPLGQGFATGVGMAIAAKHLEARFERDGSGLFDSRIFAIVSDGDLMEGISHEAASIAGHLGLGNIIYLYDDNHVTLDGPAPLSFSEDVNRRFEGLPLAYAGGRGRQRYRGDRQGDPDRHRGEGSALDRAHPHHHRIRRASSGDLGGAWQGARR